MRVLVVEDEADMAQALAWGLRADGYIVDLADNGTDGLWKATEDRHDVIILDVMLPRIDGYQLCRGLPDQAPWPDIAQRAVRQATRLEELVEQLLLLAKGDDRRLAPSREPTDLGALLREVVATTAAGGIAVGVDGPASVTVAGDPEHLFRLFRNIVDNAIRYATHRVTVTITNPPGMVRVEIADDGPGIPARGGTRLRPVRAPGRQPRPVHRIGGPRPGDRAGDRHRARRRDYYRRGPRRTCCGHHYAPAGLWG